MTPTCTAERDSVFSRYRFLIALEAADDQHHAAAVTLWNDIRNQRVSFVTTSYVFDEVVTFFNSRDHHANAVSIGETLLAIKLVTLVHVDESMFAEAWRDFTHYADKRFSLTDCVSFVVMKRRRIKKTLATRLSLGAMPSSISSCLGMMSINIADGPVMLLPGRRRLLTKPSATGPDHPAGSKLHEATGHQR